MDTKRTAFGILLLALVVRLIAIGLWRDTNFTHKDPSEYLSLGQNIRFHSTLSFGTQHQWGEDGQLNTAGPFVPTAARAPLYPLIIASLWWHKGPPLMEIRVVQALLGGLTALLVYYMALAVFSRRCALAAGLAMALAPASIHVTASIMSEILFTFLLTLGLWLWGRRIGWLAGMVLGAATLTRAVLMPFILMLALMALVHKFNRGLHAKIVLGALAVVLPWTVRNAVTQHALVPIAVQGWGSNLLFATVDVPYGSGDPWLLYGADSTLLNILKTTHSESEAEPQMARAALQIISQHPLHWFWVRTKQYPRLFIASPAYLYQFVPLPRQVIRGIFLFGDFLLLVLSFIGVFMARREWRRTYHLALFPLLLSIMQFPVLTDWRYGIPMVPMMVIFAAFAAFEVLSHGVRRREEGYVREISLV